ncbi:serine hydrolase domain-containing protein [Streptomyces sp. GQFP]|uniref:serine hydrolase domain-containing protein n=1 Tax=Streptomyces sp. GQFP TaxID=2907545 RepID=UPI001F43FE9D|nr:serine hydrolase domain-containing protein [Streptomyces sp. GQFP]UIX34583.1 beta-lactamase family protein [Streptomyces sp. GQFP]
MSTHKGLVGIAAAVAVAAGALTAPTAVAAPTERQARTERQANTHDATRKAMDEVVKSGVTGVVVEVADGQGVWKATAGVGNLKTKQPRNADDRYRAGSITKTFIATVLLQLEAEGRLSLDDTVDKWLPGVVHGNGHDGRKITVRQLLNHTSGIFDYTDDLAFQLAIFLPQTFAENRYRTWTPAELMTIAMSHKPSFAPGTSWSYSNTNYLLAGMVINKVTGKSYGDEVRARVIEPLGLHGTYMPGTDPGVPQPSSRAYSKFDLPGGRIYDVTEMNPSWANSAGEIISTAGDLNRFSSALLRGKLLPAAQLAEMKATFPAPLVGGDYGLGIFVRKLTCGVEIWGHSGGLHGSNSEAVTTADGKHSLALNFNDDWGVGSTKIIEAEFCGS